jgi:cation transport ATPase
MLILEILALGGLSYVGTRVARHRKNKVALEKKGTLAEADSVVSPPPVKVPVSPARIKRDLRLSGVALGLASSGVILGAPLLSVMSLPSLISVSLPTFRSALRELRQGQIETDANTSLRLLLCMVSGLYGLAALDLTLQMAFRRRIMQAEQDFNERLAVVLGQPTETVWVSHDGAELEVPLHQINNETTIRLNAGDIIPCAGIVSNGQGRVRPILDTDSKAESVDIGDAVQASYVMVEGHLEVSLQHLPVVLPDLRQELEQAASGKTALAKLGVETGTRLAPWMMGIFLVGLPLVGFGRSSVFLTTRLGQQMDELGPYTSRQAITAGLEHGLFIRELPALERANTIDAIMFDAALLNHPAAKGLVYPLLASLRSRRRPAPVSMGIAKPFALYVVADDDETGQVLKDTFGFDDYFNEPLDWGRIRLIKSLQQAGRQVCYLGLPDQGDPVLKQATLSVAWCPDGLPKSSSASILLGREHLRDLPSLFDLARAFVTRQGSNFLTPLGVDLLNISTSVFLGFGLFYSVMFSNVAALVEVSGSGFVKREPLSAGSDDTDRSAT